MTPGSVATPGLANSPVPRQRERYAARAGAGKEGKPAAMAAKRFLNTGRGPYQGRVRVQNVPVDVADVMSVILGRHVARLQERYRHGLRHLEQRLQPLVLPVQGRLAFASVFLVHLTLLRQGGDVRHQLSLLLCHVDHCLAQRVDSRLTVRQHGFPEPNLVPAAL